MAGRCGVQEQVDVTYNIIVTNLCWLQCLWSADGREELHTTVIKTSHEVEFFLSKV